eukprot:TRINITY_DN10774_c0_g1_i1.p1 TRINITY_DN10774_c0_g1~~TRINITY_DN10774_c0_g1_i1.p1  ORF type:complete len:496 (+),score=95.67 TRINITY_DN10774_c0_g1_i1:191-1489(+)
MQNERRFAVLLENLPLASLMLNADWKIIFVNNQLLQLTSWTKEEILDHEWVDIFVPPDKREKIRNMILLVSLGLLEVPKYEETEVETKYGTRLIIGWNYTVIKDKQGSLLGLSAVGNTISNEPKVGSEEEIKPTKISDGEIRSTEETPKSPKNTQFSIIRPLKSGENVSVQLALDLHTKCQVAMKTLRKEVMKPDEIERARREIQIMEQLNALNNPHIVKLIASEETPQYFNMIVEYVSGGELMALVKENKGLSEQQAHKLFKQLLCAIECCHANQIIHRDIKLQNILLDENRNIKLIDFGLSNFVEKGIFRNTFCGTPAYAPPEILLGNQYTGPEVDLWSLGVVLYSMLTTEFPFHTIGDILKGKFKAPEKISAECLDLLTKVLMVKKEERATLEDVLKHPWVINEPCRHDNSNTDLPDEGSPLKKLKTGS